ncbi:MULTISPECIES: hypothetical protein [Butyricimonas]|uniref:hypothetical protein n=1 Tax=Butyricimonas TaxID=574697 RepID=UPI0007FB59B4|nr:MULTISPECIES: hypothetical protein [Butyricimonas]
MFKSIAITFSSIISKLFPRKRYTIHFNPDGTPIQDDTYFLFINLTLLKAFKCSKDRMSKTEKLQKKFNLSPEQAREIIDYYFDQKELMRKIKNASR